MSKNLHIRTTVKGRQFVGNRKMSKTQSAALRLKWESKIYEAKDSDNGDNYSQSVTPP